MFQPIISCFESSDVLNKFQVYKLIKLICSMQTMQLNLLFVYNYIYQKHYSSK